MLEAMRQAGAKKIFVDIVSGDDRARGLWKSIGFKAFLERLVLQE